MSKNMRLHITADRDSVCAGDDCTSHKSTFSVQSSCTIHELLNAAWKASALAGIAGGQATWLIDVGGYEMNCIGVMAQQWTHPRLIVPVETTAEALFSGRPTSLYFRYWCQSNPDAVFEAVRSGMVLPERHL